MIDPKTLRIGNILRWEDESNDLVTVTAINDAGEVPYIKYTELSRPESGGALLEEFIPVPITEELLQKLGFGFSYRTVFHDNSGYSHYSHAGSFSIAVHEGGATYDRFTSVRNLHDLQNLLYCIKGYELPITL